LEDALTIQLIIDPADIEPELIRIWDSLAKEKKTTRASLFNLIVFTKLSSRTDYFRNIVQKVVEKFPCRTLFISHDPDSPNPYLKTAISVLSPSTQDASIACDQIDIGVGGFDLGKVPSVILPHLLPDLPNYLLWAEDPSIPNPLFASLSKLATRIIFDSESADSLLAFAKTLLDLHKKTGIEIADLNWARTQGWRDLIASTFDTRQRQELLKEISLLKIVYNSRQSEFFCHLKIQAMYLLAWASSRLGWKFEKATPSLHFQFKAVDARIQSENWQKLGSGTVISVAIHTSDGHVFEAGRIKEAYHYAKIQFSSDEQCDLPYRFVLGQTATGQSLVKEICTKGTSMHYLEMLEELTILDKDQLC
jgi:glucose-6-phosphate dehydrogenase assembly protein OpcA